MKCYRRSKEEFLFVLFILVYLASFSFLIYWPYHPLSFFSPAIGFDDAFAKRSRFERNGRGGISAKQTDK